MFRSLEPEVLRVTFLGGVSLGQDTRSVVDSQFVCASASGRGTNILGGSVERDRLEPVGIVRSDGAQDDKEESFVGRADTNGSLGTNYWKV